MAEPQSTPGEQAPPAAPKPWPARMEASVLEKVLVAGSLGVLVMIGLFLTNYSAHRGRLYWSAMFPIFGLISLWNATVGRQFSEPLMPTVIKHALHWLVPILAVWIVFLELRWGQMDADAVALMTVLILAVTCFLAGVHLDRSFLWVSAILALASVFGTEIEGYIWIIAVLAIAAIAITVYSLILLRRHHWGVAHRQ
ncbi:MAG TPA: hypothetical protein VMA09_14550 [Candidatus Binataceae bacterium]|nr:hypothetical protein [Candidatus Binataceae bacterium]